MKLLAAMVKGSLLIAILANTTHTHAEDLAYIYTKATENDHEYRAAEANYRARLENKNINRAGLLPQINAQGSWSDNNTEESGTTSSAFRNSSLPATTDSTSTNYALSLEQPLFNMTAWHAYKAGSAVVNIAEAEFKSAQQALIVRTAQAYFDTLQAAANLETSLTEEKALSHQLEQVKQRFEVGLSAITEVHEAQATYDSAVAERLVNQGMLAISFESLEVLTGEPYSQLAALKENFVAVLPQPAEREEWVKRAIDNNYALEAAQSNAESARQTAKSRKSEHYPTLRLSGRYSSNNNDRFTTETDQSDIDTDTRSISLTLNVPIYSGGRTSASRRQAQQQSIQARELYLKSQRDVVQAARSQHLTVVTTVSTIKAREQAIVSTESALEATKAGYSVGTRNLVDVLNAQRSLFRAKRAYYTALYSYVTNTFKLKEVAGILTLDDVVQLNNWLDAKQPVHKNWPTDE